jgi:hypothetical protein
MRARSLVPLLALALAACSSRAPVRTTSTPVRQAIINGGACAPDEAPTAVAILVDATLDLGGATDITAVMCTGTLIAPDVVLSAAHCATPELLLPFGFGSVTRADYYVSFDADLSAYAGQQASVALPESAIPVREAYANPEFDPASLSGEAAQSVNGPGDFKDISLYFLSAAVTDVEPEIVIAPDEVAQLVEGAPVEIAGWGQQVATSSPFEQPEPGTVGIKICGATTVNELGDKEMQVGGDASTTRKCHGDSGGPTYLDVDTDHARTRRVVGITSHAYDAEDCNKGGVDTRVDAWLSWMDTEMTKRCTDGTRVWCDVPGVIPASFYDPGNPGNPDDDGNGDDADDLGDDEEPPPFGCASTSPTSPTGGGALALVLLAVLRARVSRRSSSSA